ncbi:MAG: GyrI-like domain-containing protein, partial [Actinobacteria bacterium]|nr:GyrI-like domain-containing protein [Actinomycetota bacterium]
MGAKVDFKKDLDGYRARQGEFRRLLVPEMQYLMIDGHGDPNTSAEFAEAVEALYPLAYAVKFMSKRELGRDYAVPPLEGLWWADDMASFTSARDKSSWDWTLMLMVPQRIGADGVSVAGERLRAKRPPARIDDVRFATLAEGECVQTLHIGAFDDEAAVLA